MKLGWCPKRGHSFCGAQKIAQPSLPAILHDVINREPGEPVPGKLVLKLQQAVEIGRRNAFPTCNFATEGVPGGLITRWLLQIKPSAVSLPTEISQRDWQFWCTLCPEGSDRAIAPSNE